MRHPKVTVITPLYNSARFIEATLESLRRQTFEDWEAILIDDGSTDDTPERVKPFLQDARFSYIRQENHGIAGARNTGVRTARGQWVCLLDHDDRWLPTKLEKQLAFAHANQCDIVCTDAFVVQEHSRSLYTGRFPAEFIAQVRQINTDPSVDAFGLLIRHNFLCASSVMLRKALFDKAGLFEPDAVPADDYDMWLRCMPDAKLGYIKEPLIEYHVHAGNYSHNLARMLAKIIHALHKSAQIHSQDERRRKQFGDALIFTYHMLLTGLLEERRYGSALRHMALLAARGRTGLRLLYWIADRDLLDTFFKFFAGSPPPQNRVFGGHNFES